MIKKLKGYYKLAIKNTLLIFILTGLLLLIIAPMTKELFNGYIENIITTIGVSILSSTILSYMLEKIQINKTTEIIENLINQKFPSIESIYNTGLEFIDKKFPFEKGIYKKDFLSSSKITIVMNDGKIFFSGNELFSERILDSNKETNIVLLNYEQEDIMSALNRKNEHKKNYYQDKIKELLSRDLNNLNVNIYLNSNYNTMAIILMENYAMISLFRISSGKTIVPHMVFKNGGTEYKYIKEDVDKLLEKSIKYEPEHNV